MKKRIAWSTLCLSSLTIGALIYGLYRPNTYIGFWISEALKLPMISNGCLHDLIAYYLPDYLWAFSLTTAFYATFLPTKKQSFLFAVLVGIYGTVWEYAQHSGLLSGTADLWDITAYIAAILSAVIINFLFSKEKTV